MPTALAGLGTGTRPDLAAARPWPRGRLRPIEMAEAAVFADLSVGIHLLIWLLPVGAGLQVVAVTPLAVLATRHRARAVVMATVAGGAVSFLVGGLGLAAQMVLLGMIGEAVGMGLRRGWGSARSVAFAVGSAGAVAAAGSLGLLVAFSNLRRLSLAQVSLTWRGVSHILSAAGFPGVAHWGDSAVGWTIGHWWLVIPAAELVLVAAGSFLVRALTVPVLERLQEATGPMGAGVAAVSDADPAPAPVPVQLREVGFSYPGAEGDALSGVTLELPAHALVALIGPNGSGKSTLARILAGWRPTSGTVTRPGGAGLGQISGTAIVFQRPESQVLGARVRDDVTWGLPRTGRDEVDRLLDLVGLDGLAEQETSTLSGGQLQRLAIASALARRPALLISDEATAMLDPVGRRDVVELLRHLSQRSASTVVHVTHRVEETRLADLVVSLNGGRMTAMGPPSRPPGPARPPARTPTSTPSRPAPSAEPLVRLASLGHVYDRGSPWARRALVGIDLDIAEGERLVVTGGNGAGKSTLAWVLAGLIAPSEGSATFAGEPLESRVGQVGMAFQQARLQLFRPTVAADVGYGGSDPEVVNQALTEVGFEPQSMGERRVDGLSGGEQRRVALAGLLVRHPRLIVLDEPLAGLDEETREVVVSVLDRLCEEHGMATVTVLHDLAVASLLGRRLVSLADGRLVADGALQP